jgi:hypothetical protein
MGKPADILDLIEDGGNHGDRLHGESIHARAYTSRCSERTDSSVGLLAAIAFENL